MAKRVSKENLTEHTSFMFDNTNVLKRNTLYTYESTVNKGQIVLKCTTQGTTANTTLDLSSVSVGDLLSDGTAEWEVISVTGYGIGSGGGGGGTSVSEWATATSYRVGDLVIEDNKIWQCNTAHISTTFSADINNWTLISGSGLEDWKPNHSYKENDIFVSEHQIYKALVGFTSGNTFGQIDILEDYTLAGETPILWTEGQEITTNDIVEYDGNYYKALIDFTCGKEFTKTAFEEYVPKSLTDEEVEEVINSYTPEFSGGTGGGNYSTEEQRIGTWIDGKPLYQKTYTGTTPTAQGTQPIQSISEVDNCIELNGYMVDSYQQYCCFNFYQDVNVYASVLYYNGSIYTKLGGENFKGRPYYVTIKYTKTTD